MYQKIAFVDDEVNVLKSLKWIFQDEPYHVFTFQNPLEALKTLEEDEFALVIADQVMPKMEGTVFLQQVKKRWPKTECMIMTAYSNFDKVNNFTNQIILKPWNINGLKSIVQNAVAFFEKKQAITKVQPTKKKRILYVENDQALIKAVETILERYGYEVVITNWCTHAIRLLQSRPEFFDLVISDMNMPDMTGIELSQELMRIRPDIPVILCTGNSQDVTDELIKDAGIKEFILKPFYMGDLAKTVRKVLD